MPRLGLFGGTFDPPHLGHLAIAEHARQQLRLDRVLFMPSGRPPHKRDRALSPAADRLAMTRLAARGNPGFAVSAWEARGDGASYTVDTLRALAARRPGARLVLLIGEDSLEEFATWREPEAIRALAELAVAPRDGGRPRRSRRPARGVVHLDAPRLDVSSSAIRAALRAGRSARYLVPDPVLAYIERRGLYRPASRRGA